MNEQELIQGLRRGEEPAFRWLVESHRNRLYHTILTILQDTAEAEDVTQETFIKAYQSVSQFRGDSSLYTWLARIAVRKAIDQLRRRQARDRLKHWFRRGENAAADKAVLFDHPGVQAENREKAGILFRAVAGLPDNQRVAFTLIKIQGLSYEEACGLMNRQLKAVESLVMRAQINLQKKLEAYYRKNCAS